MHPLAFQPDPYGPSDEFDPTPQHERPIRDLPDEPLTHAPSGEDADSTSLEDEEEGYEGQQCPVCGYDLTRDGDCTGNGCGADLSS